MTPRNSRKSSRMTVSEPTRVTIRRGDRHCCGILIDFGPSSCAVRLTDGDFDRWTISDMKSEIIVILHGEHRLGRVVRLQQLPKPYTTAWILGMVLQ